MDWASFSTMKADDINAIVAYLRTVPPVSNKIPRLTWKPLPSGSAKPVKQVRPVVVSAGGRG